jgi:AcrR family transcriptional regulator
MSYIAERRLEEKERRRAEIVDAAEAAGRESGLDSLTMDDVARRARLSRALLYVYFQDRSDLMFGLAERAMSMLHARFLEAAERHGSGLEQVSAMGRAYVAFAQEFPVLFDALARCELKSPEPTDGSPSEQAWRWAVIGCRSSCRRLCWSARWQHCSDIGSLMPATSRLGIHARIIQRTTTKSYALTHRGVAAVH